MFSSNTSQVSGDATYIEDVFSTWLYTGNSSTQTITNGIDLAGKGGLVWIKDRSQGTGYHHILQDTARGASWCLFSNLTNAQSQDSAGTNFAFNNNGFFIGSSNVKINGSDNYVSWTFREQPKFFDVVTWTGDDAATKTISHSLGSVPGCIIAKATSATGSWIVYHRSVGATQTLRLNTTAAALTDSVFNDTTPTSTTFTVTNGGLNSSGVTYVAYLFAHNAGGFGLTGTDNVISCGSYTGNGSATGPTVTLGYEPQWVLVKKAGGTSNWFLADNLRGLDQTSDQMLLPNNSGAEFTSTGYVKPLATGFQIGSVDFDVNEAGVDYIYIAIRRGPMKTPTTGTSVFVPTAYSGNGSTQAITAGFPVDMSMFRIRGAIGQTLVNDRLRGVSQRLFTDVATGESGSVSAVTSLASNTSVTVGANGDTNSSGQTYVSWMFRRAPNYFDEICYTGTGALNAQQHNLGVAPELVITKSRSGAYAWSAYVPSLNINIRLDSTAAGTASAGQVSVSSTAVTYSAAAGSTWNGSGSTYVAYLFASCPGVSKVGSYTGTGALQNINCGFSGSARFVLIKRTDSTSNWFVWDTARGMVAGTDPSLSLNTTAAEVNANSAYTNTGGFQLLASPAADINTNGGTYIYLAIA